jgi:hypothetical protein
VIVRDLLTDHIKKKKAKLPKAVNLAQDLLLPEEPEWFAETGFPLPNRNLVPLRKTPFSFEKDAED